MVPFNFLQPIVENAFVHGFGECVRKKIDIKITGAENGVAIMVANSGKRLNAQACRSINQGICSNTAHGLAMIYQKLTAVYGEACFLKLERGKTGIPVFGYGFPLGRGSGKETFMIRAVICDDEKAALNIIRHFIETERLPIQIAGSAENGRDAWNLIQREKPDLVFMDIHMPYMNGFEIIRKLKDSRVIIITAYDSFEYAQRALRLGACDIISKPIDFEQLRQAIIRAVGWNFTGNEVVDTILAYIYENYQEKIELETLAGLTYCTASHIARVFKKHMGMSIISYVHKVRIQESVRLLKEQRLSVKEAAEAVGYRNLNHFYKYFHQYMETTPASYIKQRRQLYGENGDQ